MEPAQTRPFYNFVPVEISTFTLERFCTFSDLLTFSQVSRSADWLAHSVRNFSHEKIKRIVTRIINIDDAKALEKFQKRMFPVKELNFPETKLGEVETGFILGFMENNPELAVLNIPLSSSWRIVSNLNSFCRTLKKCSQLRVLDLPIEKQTEDNLSQLFSSIATKSLEVLTMRKSFYSKQNIGEITAVIRKNPHLRVVRTPMSVPKSEDLSPYLESVEALKALKAVELRFLQEGLISPSVLTTASLLKNLEWLDLSNCVFDKERVAQLKTVLERQVCLKSLSLTGSKFKGKSARIRSPFDVPHLFHHLEILGLKDSELCGAPSLNIFCKALKDPECSLREFSLSREGLRIRENRLKFIESLKANHSLRALHMQLSGPRQVFRAFSEYLQSCGLEYIRLHILAIADTFAIDVIKGIGQNITLQEISITGFTIPDDDRNDFLHLIKTHPSMKRFSCRIHLFHSWATKEANARMIKILEAIKDNQTLEKFELQNPPSSYFNEHEVGQKKSLQTIIDAYGETNRVLIS